MTEQDSGSSRSQQLIAEHVEDLRLKSVKLCERRSDGLHKFYGSVFDDNPGVLAFVGPVDDRMNIRPTARIIHREAKFVLDGDASESVALDTLWPSLHELVSDKLSPAAMARVATMNSAARSQILECQAETIVVALEINQLLDAGKYDEAWHLMQYSVGDVAHKFDAISAPYHRMTLQHC
jgi:hypothetical protein